MASKKFRFQSTRTVGHWQAVGLLLALLLSRPILATPIDAIVAAISQPSYTQYVQDLQNFGTRYYSTTGNANALTYIYDAFYGFGLNVSYDTFSYGGTYKNVVATLPGKTHPEKIYIVGAHMDSTSDQAAATNAPGADDNASGMAAVMEMARTLVNWAFDATIKFIGFNAEEQHLHGSQAYVADAIANHENIVGMLNFDMIAYAQAGQPKSVYLAGDTALVNALDSNALEYTSLQTVKNYANVYGSDHYYFHSSLLPGSSSAFAIEAAPEIVRTYNPNYHKITDTTAYLDFAYATDIVRMGVATVAELAGAIPEPATIFCFLTGLALLVYRPIRAR
ncbi:MAG: M28 family metallopeptidase [Candidatus Methylumidiphilus sp.]